MINLKSLIFIATLVTSPLLTAQPRSPSFFSYNTIKTIEQEAQNWISSQVAGLSYHDIQILANTLYLMYAESLLTVSVERQKKNLLLAMWRVYHDDAVLTDEADALSGISRQVQALQELTTTQRFIHAAWQSCVAYIDLADFKNTHDLCSQAIAAFVQNTKDTTMTFINEWLVELEDGIPVATNIIEHTDSIARDIRSIARLIHTTIDPLEKFDNILSLSPTAQNPSADLIQIGMQIDEYQYHMLDTIKMISITYYKQLYFLMQQQEIPLYYQTYLFDGDGIIAPDLRTEPLQDPTYLSYMS